MFIKPSEGVVLRDPATNRVVPATGAHVPDSAFWLRRLRDGDVVECATPATPAAKPASPKTTTAAE